MKFKTFRNIVAGGGLSAAAVGGSAWYVTREPIQPNPIVQPVDDPIAQPVAAPIEQPVAAPIEQPVAAKMSDAAFVEDHLVKKLGTAGGDKIKDALGASKPKVNLYGEGGTLVRAKVDYDRDEKWDEKWDLKDGVVTVRRASKDDENYDQTRVVGAATETPKVEPAAKTPGLRPVDDDALRLAKAGIRGEKAKDVTKGKAYKVNLYSDGGSGVVDRAKLDLDRDDKWDEKWTWKGGSVERQVAPKDDENYSETWELSSSGWKKK